MKLGKKIVFTTLDGSYMKKTYPLNVGLLGDFLGLFFFNTENL